MAIEPTRRAQFLSDLVLYVLACFRSVAPKKRTRSATTPKRRARRPGELACEADEAYVP